MSRAKRKTALDWYVITDREDYFLAVQACNRTFVEQLGDGLLWRRYVRNPDGSPQGLVIVFEYMKILYVAGSYCGSEDYFSKDLAFFFATQKEEHIRAFAPYSLNRLPQRCRKDAAELIAKAERYYGLTN